jgi:hypothetical protein
MIYTYSLINILGAWLAEPTDESINKHLASISKVSFISNFLHDITSSICTPFFTQFCKTTKYSYPSKKIASIIKKICFPLLSIAQ